MIAKREKQLSGIMITVQILLSLLLFYAVELVRPHINVNIFDLLFYMSQITLIWVFLMVKFRMGIIFRMKGIPNMIKGYLVMMAIGGAMLTFETFICRLVGYEAYAYKNILTFIVLNFVLLVVFKLVFYYTMTFLRRKGRYVSNVVIIADSLSISFIRTFVKTNDWGYRLKAIITPDEVLQTEFPDAKLMKTNAEINNYVTQKTIDEVLYCIPLTDKTYNLKTLIADIDEIGISLFLVQESFLKNLDENKTASQNFEKFLKQYSGYSRYISLKFKALIDLTFSSLLLVILSPLLAIIAFLIVLDDGGPVFFRQQRIGLNGRRFMCYKFRTMCVNAEALLDKLKSLNEEDGPAFKIKNDPRVTKVGKFLRKTSLDELPQFYNVIKGEMAIVGPRPPLLSEVQQYKRYQLRRLSMKPGITCIWQVKGRNKVSFVEWMEMDLQYIDNWSLWLDFKLILQTAFMVFKGTGS